MQVKVFGGVRSVDVDVCRLLEGLHGCREFNGAMGRWFRCADVLASVGNVIEASRRGHGML